MGTLRTLLALSVVLAHAPGPITYTLVGGRNAVQLFYMISGFVITHVLLTVPAYGDARTFYASRALRIFPVYFGAAGFTLAWWALADPAALAFFRQLPAAAIAFLVAVNTTIVGQEWALFMDVDGGALRFTADFRASQPQLWHGLVVPQAWTLSLELMFYALAPWLVRRRGWLWTVLAVSLAARAAAVAKGWGADDPWSYRFFPFEIALFAAGSLSYQLMLEPWRRACRARRGLSALGTALVAAAVLAYPLVPAPEWAATLALIALAWVAMPLTFIFQESAPLDRKLGELSFPLYIGHYAMIAVALAIASRMGASHVAVVVTTYVVLAFVAAWALLAVIGWPVERLRTRLRRGPPPVERPVAPP